MVGRMLAQKGKKQMNSCRNNHRWLFWLGIICCLDTLIIVAVGAGINVGTMLPGTIGALILITWGLYRRGVDIARYIRTVPGKIMVGLFAVWLISFLIVEGLIIYGARSQADQPVDYLVVLGAGVRGKQVSLTLKERLDVAATYIKVHPKVTTIVSGGKGFGEETTEASAMKAYLTQKGLPGDKILMEEQSTSTAENFRYTRSLLDRFDRRRPLAIMVISSDFHLYRAKFLARQFGFTPYVIPANTPWYLIPNSYAREYFAIVKSALFDKN